MKNQNTKGFTLVELLVVIAIIGMLSTLAVIALNSARSKARDAVRVSDIKQIQTALELYFADNGKYPDVAAATDLGATATNILCDITAGFGNSTTCAGETTYMGQVPGEANIPDSQPEYQYLDTDSLANYQITYTLEGKAGELEGSCTATNSGVTCS